MLIHIPTKRVFNNRLEAKRGLGGEIKYDLAQKNGEILFINSKKDIQYLNKLNK